MIGNHRPTTVEVAVAGPAEVAESPVWDDGSGELVWVDIPAGFIRRWRPGTGVVSTLAVGQPVGAIALQRGGGLVAAVRDGFAVVDEAIGTTTPCAVIEADRPNIRMNDGKCDRAGRFWAGTMAEDMRPGAGCLYRLDPDLKVTTVLTGVSLSNGIGWSPDDRTMYYVDSVEHTIDAFEFDLSHGRLGVRRPFVAIDPGDGMPDGISVDADGNVWVALWGGGVVRRYLRTGDLDVVVQFPVAQVTSCTLGGPDLRDLYVTSASRGLSAEDRGRQPHAGAIFHVRVDVPGSPAARFGG